MQRLKHPIRSLREPFGKAGLPVAILALVLVMVGGAYAAGGLSKSQEKQVTKIAKKYAGKPGTNGAAGPAGATGPAGAAGAAGKTGKEGPEGKEGSPWTAGGTLPKGRTEPGVWGAAGIPANLGEGLHGIFATISFSIPIANELSSEGCEAETEPCQVHVILKGETTPQGCIGDVAHPGAKEGNLCVFVHSEIPPKSLRALLTENQGNGEPGGAGTTGTKLTIVGKSVSEFEEEGESPEAAQQKVEAGVSAAGTWAVTAAG
jgi:hypothetical protein